MSSGSNTMIIGGTINYQNRTSRGMDILMEWVATDAFHNSKELYDTPKCHPHTRVAVLDDIMQWVSESESAQDDFMMWLFGPAGAGKSAIAKRIAEIAAERGLLIADFFFSKSSPTRNTPDRLIATLAYQLAVLIPDTRSYIEDTIERDPAIFHKYIPTQIDTLLIKPISAAQIVPSKKLIIIDGLDECKDSKAQVAILEAISQSFIQHNLPIKFLIVSRPEPDIVTSFDCNKLLKPIHRRLALDDTYRPDDDIRLFFSDSFEQIRLTHPLRSTIPAAWPGQEILETLVKKSSGQFIYASTVVKFVESSCHRPTARLNVILGISPPGKTNPFAELDALYSHLLSSVDDIEITLHVLSFYVTAPNFASQLYYFPMLLEHLLSLEPGGIQLALINLSSILTYHESSGKVKVLHASFVDFLSDKRRSIIYYIDKASTCADFVRRILQCVNEPDGILAGNGTLFRGLIDLYPYILAGQLRSDILHFDLDALLNASITRQYKGLQSSSIDCGWTIDIFCIWKSFLDGVALEDRAKKEALDRLNKCLESRLQIYQSHCQLQLLLASTIPDVMYYANPVPYCRSLDILLEMEDHDLHLVDQNALDLRHVYVGDWSQDFVGMISHYVDSDTYSSAALHCMRFLSNPPEYSERNEYPEMGLIYAEWEATCDRTLGILREFLQQANTSPELVQFISNNDIHPAVKNHFFADVWEVDVLILAFLSRASSVCPNWRIISVIERSRIITHQQPSEYANYDDGKWEATQYLIEQRLDQCCSNAMH